MRMKRRTKWMLVVFVLLVGLLIFLLTNSPFFQIEHVEISGNEKQSKEDIVSRAELSSQPNIFTTRSTKLKKRIETLPYVREATIEKKLPRTLLIQIIERIPRGYVKYDAGAYLYIDEEGMVLEVGDALDKAVPIITGLQYDSFSIGKKLEVETETSFVELVKISKLLDKYEITTIKEIDINDITDIHLFLHNADVVFGDMSHADEKMQRIQFLLEYVDPNDKVKLFVNDIELDPRIEYIQ